MADTSKAIIVEQSFYTSIHKLWDAISKPEQMRQWFFENLPSFKPQAGFETQFNVQTPNKDFLHVWKLTEVVPLKKITYNWKYGGYSGSSFVSFELFNEKLRAKLRVTHQGMENFPQDVPEFSRESCTEGWNYFIKNRLKKFLEKTNTDRNTYKSFIFE